MSTIPHGWAQVSIGDVVDPSVDQHKPIGTREITYVEIGSIDNRAKRIASTRRYPALEAPSRARQWLSAADVLVSMTRPNLNAVAMVPPDLEGAVGSTGFQVLRAGSIAPQWLYYFVQTITFVRSMSSVVQGVLYPALRPRDILEFKMPLAPLPEQHRIVAEIEKQFTRLDASLSALERVRTNLRRYRSATLVAACEGRLVPTEAELARAEGRVVANGREVATGAELFDFITSGSRGWAKYYSDTGAAFLRVGNLDHGSISLDLRHVQRVRPPATAEGTRTRVRASDILISITADVGMIAVIPKEIEETYINQHLALARPCVAVNPAYLGWMLASAPGQAQFDELRRGATKVGLGLDDIRALSVPLPPLAEQHRIVAEVERRLSLVEKLEAVVDVAQKRAAALRQSILKRAFEGKLVEQDPDDERADALLERIRAERAASATNGRAPKRTGRKNVRA